MTVKYRIPNTEASHSGHREIIMPEQVTFKCLRCGNEWRGVYDADVERMCPKCRSNSVRRIKEKDKTVPQAGTSQSAKS